MIGLPPALLPLGNLAAQVLGLNGQSFTTLPTPNKKTALYVISIRSPGQARASVKSVTLPISPSSIVKEYTALSTVYDVAGSPGQLGVSRNIDQYGNTPPTYILEGTTGWQRHASDGYAFTGMQAIAQLQTLLDQYAHLNQGIAQSGQASGYTLEFYDYFADEYWQVEPVGRQGISQDATRPLLFRYSFRWAAVHAVSNPPPPVTADPILAAFQIAAPTALSSLAVSIGSTLSSYAPSTGGALLSAL